MLLRNEYLSKFNRDHNSKNELINEEFFFNRLHIFRRDTRNLSPKRLCVNINSYYTLWICIHGTGTLLVDNIAFDLQEGEGLVIYPGQQHMRMPDTQIHGEWLLVRFSGKVPSWIEAMRMHKINIPEESIEYLEKLTSAHDRYMQTKNDKEKTACSCYLALLLNSLRGATLSEKGRYEEFSKHSANDYVKQTCQMLLNPAYTKTPFDQIARKIGVTSTYLRHCVKEQTGASPGEIRRAQRLSLAKHLLQHSSSSISLIAEKSGFDSIYSFSRFFKKHTGISPSKYRQQYR